MIVAKKHIAKDIVNYLKDNHKKMLELLKEMVTIESPSNNKEALNNIILFLTKKLKKLGFYTIHVSGNKTGGYLYARPMIRKKDMPLQLLIGHCDTVWNINTLKEIPIIQKNDKLSGPGVYDMKAGITQMIFAIKALQELQIECSVIPVILIHLYFYASHRTCRQTCS